MISGLDPAAFAYWTDTNNYIHSGDAQYVQIIHTSYIGTQMQRGDSDIYVSSPNWFIQHNHKLAYRIHELVATKKLILIASKNGSGTVINLQITMTVNTAYIKIGDDECLVRVYAQPKIKNVEKIYRVSFSNDIFSI